MASAKKKRLLWQLYPSYLLITLVCLVAATWFASHSLRKSFLSQNAADLEARARLLEDQIIERLDPLDASGIDRLCKRIGARVSTRMTVILPSGKVVGDSREDPTKMDNHMDRPEVMKALKGETGVSTMRYSSTLEEEMMYVGVPLDRDGKRVGVVRMSVPFLALDEAVRDVEIRIALWGLLIAIFAAVLSLWVSRRISRPLEEMKRGAERFARGRLDHRLPVPGTEEMRGLAVAMNQMAGQLSERMSTVIRQRGELEAVLSSMVEGVIGVDLEEHVIVMNDAAAGIFGCRREEAQGRSIQEVVRNPELQAFVKTALSSGEPVEEDILVYSRDERVLSGCGMVLVDGKGMRAGALIVLNDVTRLRRLENIRKDFVANVSHEIKTPITAIRGFVETLRDSGERTPEETERFLGIIHKHVHRLEAIVEDLMSLSRIEQEAEREEILLSEGRLQTVLQTAVQICEGRAEEKKIAIELSCPPDMTALIDPPLLEQAVANLLDNAVKYSGEESAVHVEALGTDHEVIIRVRDQGRGIEKEHLPRIFERFYRVDKARSRKMGGTGLGLAIVKHIVEAHKGRVEVESILGRGSTFSIILPRPNTSQ
ncbi:MAG: two-component system histidine kinase PnpS [Desulfatiglandales bacterium]